MELRHLRYFVAVADALNFTRAAQTLRVAQPALSRQIRQLEQEIGVTLLERSRRGVTLTQAGTAFLAEARSLLHHTDRAVQTARARASDSPGPLNLGYVWGLFHSVVPDAVEHFRQKHPGVAVNLFDLTATQQAEALVEGRLDVGFIGFADEADAVGLAHRAIGECTFVAALPKGHPAARRPLIPLDQLAEDFFFVISERGYPGAARLVLEACAEAGFRPRILQAAERGHTILSLVASRCGVALLPESLRALPHAGVIFRPVTHAPRGELCVAWHPKGPSPLREAFIATLF